MNNDVMEKFDLPGAKQLTKVDAIESLLVLLSLSFRMKIAPTSLYRAGLYDYFIKKASELLDCTMEGIDDEDKVAYHYMNSNVIPLNVCNELIPRLSENDITRIEIESAIPLIASCTYALNKLVVFNVTDRTFKIATFGGDLKQFIHTMHLTPRGMVTSISESNQPSSGARIQFLFGPTQSEAQFGIAVFKALDRKNPRVGNKFIIKLFTLPYENALLNEAMIGSMPTSKETITNFIENSHLEKKVSIMNAVITNQIEMDTVTKYMKLTFPKKKFDDKPTSSSNNTIDPDADAVITSPLSLFNDEVNKVKISKSQSPDTYMDEEDEFINKVLGGGAPVKAIRLDHMPSPEELNNIIGGFVEGEMMGTDDDEDDEGFFKSLYSQLNDTDMNVLSFKAFLNSKLRAFGCIPCYKDRYGRMGCIRLKNPGKKYNGCKACIRHPDYIDMLKADMINVLKSSPFGKSEPDAETIYKNELDQRLAIYQHWDTYINDIDVTYIRHGYIDSPELLKEVLVDKTSTYGYYDKKNNAWYKGYCHRSVVLEGTVLYNLHGRLFDNALGHIPVQSYACKESLGIYMPDTILNRIKFGLVSVFIYKYAKDKNNKLVEGSDTKTLVLMPLAFTDYNKTFDE